MQLNSLLIECNVTRIGEPEGELAQLAVTNRGEPCTVIARVKNLEALGGLKAGRIIRVVGALEAPDGVVRIVADHIELKPQARAE